MAKDIILEKQLPNEVNAERSVLGAIFMDNDAAHHVFPFLESSDFYSGSHRKIYSAMQVLSAKGDPVDLITVIAHLSVAGELESCGGDTYINKLVDGVPRVSNIESYGRIVTKKSRLRKLIEQSNQFIEEAMTSADEPKDIIERSAQSLISLANDERGIVRARSWKDVAISAVQELEDEINNPAAKVRLEFGIKSLDEQLAGLRNKEFSIITGPTGHGKTLLCMQLCNSSSDKGYKGLIFSAEMTAESLAKRQLARDARVLPYFIRRPEQLNADSLERLHRACEIDRSLKIVDEDITPTRIWAMSELEKRIHGLDFVVVDYDQLVIDAGLEIKRDNDVFKHQRAFVKQAVKLTRKLDISFILICQLRKSAAQDIKSGVRKPNIEDVWGDSIVKNSAENIIWIHREFFFKNMNPDYESIAKAFVLKARNDGAGMTSLKFDIDKIEFADDGTSDEKKIKKSSQEIKEDDSGK